MYVLHATKKLRDRLPEPNGVAVAATTRLGSWYATALFWKPQVALLVNESTLLPVFVPLAPARTLLQRLPGELAFVLEAHGVDRVFIDHEIAEMRPVVVAKTASRSLLGVMNDFTMQARNVRALRPGTSVLELSMLLAHTPCSPLYKSLGFPDLELAALVERSSDATT